MHAHESRPPTSWQASDVGPMKAIRAIIVIVVVALHARADVRLFAWQETKDQTTGEKLFGLYLAPSEAMKFMEADANGDTESVANRSGIGHL